MGISDIFNFLKYKKVKTVSKKGNNRSFIIKRRKDGEYFFIKIIDKEVEIYKKLQCIESTYIPVIYRVESDRVRTIIIEEYINGISLYDAMNINIGFSKKQKLHILNEIIHGIEVLHKNGIIHRDIKLSNIMLTDYESKKPNVKIIDFDISREPKYLAEKDTEILGTKGYAPPEQYGYSQTDVRSDIYSFGVVMNELFKNEKVGIGIRKVIRKCLEFDPKRRYKSMTDVRRSLWFVVKGKCISFF